MSHPNYSNTVVVYERNDKLLLRSFFEGRVDTTDSFGKWGWTYIRMYEILWGSRKVFPHPAIVPLLLESEVQHNNISYYCVLAVQSHSVRHILPSIPCRVTRNGIYYDARPRSVLLLENYFFDGAAARSLPTCMRPTAQTCGGGIIIGGRTYHYTSHGFRSGRISSTGGGFGTIEKKHAPRGR